MARRTSALDKLINAWETVQVELHGQYSTKRLHALRDYIDSTTNLDAAIVLVLTALPSLCVLIGIDALPMVSPAEGASKQTFGFWLRCFFTGWILIFFITMEVCQVEPSLPMSIRRMWFIATATSLFMLGPYLAEIETIGFPVPFTLQLQVIPMTFSLFMWWWLSWKDTLRADALAKKNVMRYINFVNTNNFAFLAYIAYNVVYSHLDGWSQIAFSALLPVMKLFLKNVTNADVHHQEDLAPVLVVFSIDVFHTLFVSLTMQQSGSSSTTLGLFMVVDAVQSSIAVYDVQQILTRLEKLKDLTEQGGSQSVKSGDILSSVVAILESSETVRRHPAIAQPRHVRDLARPSNTFSSQLVPSTWLRPSAVVPAGSLSTPRFPEKPLSTLESAQVEYAQKTLRLLHMTEFYVMLEFVEVMIATIYATYVFAISYMPNRVYYPKFATLSPSEIRAAAAQVAVYASLELLSFIVLVMVLKYQIKGFSPLRQLAFALQTHWKLVQPICLIWVHLVAQVSFEHNGSDFTFQFKWLRRENSSGPT